MIEGIAKGLILWIYDLLVGCVGYVADGLLAVFSMDTAYFTEHAPVVLEMQRVLLAAGWALLLGNLAFQALRGMASGIGLDAEDPKLLFCKSAMFSFLLVVSPQICQLGLDLTAAVIELLQVPDTVSIAAPEEAWFDFAGGWLLAVICGLILLFQLVRLFFEIGERYVVLCALVFFAPVAFAMGGSKSTEDIFKGWLRMFASMCVVSVCNVFFIKVILSAVSTVPNTLTLVPWLIFVVGACKVARRVDDIVCRLGLNAAHTGREHVMPGFFAAQTLRSLAQLVSHTAAAGQSGARPVQPGAGAGGARSRMTYYGYWNPPPQIRQATMPERGTAPQLPPVSLPGEPPVPRLPGPDPAGDPGPGPRGGRGGPGGGQTGGAPRQRGAGGSGTRPQRPPRTAQTRQKPSFPPTRGNIDIMPDDDWPPARTQRAGQNAGGAPLRPDSQESPGAQARPSRPPIPRPGAEAASAGAQRRTETRAPGAAAPSGGKAASGEKNAASAPSRPAAQPRRASGERPQQRQPQRRNPADAARTRTLRPRANVPRAPKAAGTDSTPARPPEGGSKHGKQE